MCIQFEFFYPVCGHAGTTEYRFCSSRTCRKMYRFPSRWMREFCDECFMLPDPRVKQVHKGEYVVGAGGHPTGIELALAAEIWKLAEEHMRIGTHDLLAFIGPEFQRLTDSDIKRLHSIFWLLNNELWDRIKNPHSHWNPEMEPPTDEQRTLILQLRSFIRHERIAKGEKMIIAEKKEAEQAKLKLTEIGMLSFLKHDSSCSICTTTFGHPNINGDFEFPIKTSCGHIFGQRCLEIWTSNQISKSCPTCKAMILPPTEEETARHIKEAQDHEAEAARTRGTPPWLLMLSPPARD